MRWRLVALALAFVLLGSGCGAKDWRMLEVIGVWSGAEQVAFERVLAVFERNTGRRVTYTPVGDELPAVLRTRAEGRAPPDIAVLPQPGLLAQLARSGALRPLTTDVTAEPDRHQATAWQRFGTVDGVRYGIYVKAADKSTLWYNDPVLRRNGLHPPRTWGELLETAQALADKGIGGLSLGAADGWVLTDLFENVYLHTAGPQLYDRLARHEIPWTDPSVRTALEVLRGLFERPRLLAGRPLLTDFPSSVIEVFGSAPSAALVYEGDFVANVVRASTPARVGIEARFVPFPSIGGAREPVIVGGDVAAAMRDDPATRELLCFLASPEAGVEWAKQGGFLSPSGKVPLESYPDEPTRMIAARVLAAGDSARFDMSDLAPAEFGSTRGSGQWQDFQDFLADPRDIDATMRRLEASAGKVFPR